MPTTDTPGPAGAAEPRPTPNPLARDPSPWVVRFAAHLTAGARVLDVACGNGRHARHLATLGCVVTAVDIDPACGESLRHERVTFMQRDLEAATWPFAAESFDAVVVVHYLHRPLLPRMIESLAAGGLLIYETFAAGNERFGRPRNPDFLLRPRELLEACAGLRVLAFEDGIVAGAPPAAIQRVAARRLEPDALDPVEALVL
ncbi:MAG TPA: class I SAM-dependent methyltransferase [Burkholderiaceae bacterium]|nr:class I SAM-dependent methyltransferase [Burkholderiaceae bacterium]